LFDPTTSLGQVAAAANAPPQSEAAASPANAGTEGGKGDLLKNLLDSNSLIQQENRGNYRMLLENKKQGVKAKAAF